MTLARLDLKIYELFFLDFRSIKYINPVSFLCVGKGKENLSKIRGIAVKTLR